MSVRSLNRLDRLISGLERAMEAVAGSPEPVQRSPGDAVPDAPMDDAERRHAAGLMRINHVGEVCAQALYVGQAALARTEETRRHLMHAAQEETDHLAWCAERLKQLDSRPSLLNPLWYAGSYAIGVAAAAVGDPISLGFVV
jgi:ubiquinone biosynthesis monooxygenase Coq7